MMADSYFNDNKGVEKMMMNAFLTCMRACCFVFIPVLIFYPVEKLVEVNYICSVASNIRARSNFKNLKNYKSPPPRKY